MIKAYIETDESDDIDIHEFVVLPQVGTSIAVIDRNANMHHLRVTDVRIQGLGVGDEYALARSAVGDIHVTIRGTRDPEWPVRYED